MKTYTKNYIGKGKQVNESMDIVRVVIPVEEAMKTVFEKNGISYISFEVAKMKEADKFGRTHTVYYQTREEDETETPEPKPKKVRKTKTQEVDKDDLPF
jgi:hypothetical protein